METLITLLADTDLDHVAGGNNGVVAGPGGEGCTDPQLPTKPGQAELEIPLQA